MNSEDIDIIKAVVRETVCEAVERSLANYVPKGKGKKAAKKQARSTVIQEKYQGLGPDKFKAWIQETDEATVFEAIDESGFSGPILRKFWNDPGFKEKVGEALVTAMIARSNRGSSFIGI